MSFPGSLTTIQVTGTYVSAAGTEQAGSVTFTPSAAVMDPAGVTVIAAVPVTVALSGGSFSTTLPCTDNAGLVPAGWLYNATVAVPGAAQTFSFYLPHALGSTVDMTALSPVSGSPSPSGTAYLPNATIVPASGPSPGGGFLYAENGALFWISSGNTVTQLAPD